MKKMILIAIGGLLLAACSGAINERDSSNVSLESATEELPVVIVLEPTAQADSRGYNGEAYTQPRMVNVRTGDEFALSDFAGQTVFVHMIATWCAPCLTTQRTLRDQVLPIVADEDVVFLSLSLELNIEGEDLVAYAEEEDFDWIFAVVTPEILGLLTERFGQLVTNPASSPHFILDPNGKSSPLYFGQSFPEQNIERIRAYS